MEHKYWLFYTFLLVCAGTNGFLRLSKEQITVAKCTLRSLNSTLLAVSDNERNFSKGLEDIAKHINK